MKRMLFANIVLYIVGVIVGFVEVVVGLRVLLKLFGASANASFVSWIYQTSQPLLKPFEGAFPAPVIDSRYVIEFSALFALIVYAIAGYLLAQLVDFVNYRVECRNNK